MAENLFEIARHARQDFDSGTVDRELLVRLYEEYNPQVGDIKSFVDCGLSMFPNLCCGIASIYLRHLVGSGEVVQGECQGQGHTFLSVGGKIVDITSDQYGGPRVYVGKRLPRPSDSQ